MRPQAADAGPRAGEHGAGVSSHVARLPPDPARRACNTDAYPPKVPSCRQRLTGIGLTPDGTTWPQNAILTDLFSLVRLTPDGDYAGTRHFPAVRRPSVKPERSAHPHRRLSLSESASPFPHTPLSRFVPPRGTAFLPPVQGRSHRARRMDFEVSEFRPPRHCRSAFHRREKWPKNIVNSINDFRWQFLVTRAKRSCGRRKMPRRAPIRLYSLHLQNSQSAPGDRPTLRKMAISGNPGRAIKHSYTTVNRPPSAAPVDHRRWPDEISLNTSGIMLGSRKDSMMRRNETNLSKNSLTPFTDPSPRQCFTSLPNTIAAPF